MDKTVSEESKLHKTIVKNSCDLWNSTLVVVED